jgi:hypothetical protein
MLSILFNTHIDTYMRKYKLKQNKRKSSKYASSENGFVLSIGPPSRLKVTLT